MDPIYSLDKGASQTVQIMGVPTKVLSWVEVSKFRGGNRVNYPRSLVPGESRVRHLKRGE